MPIQEKNILNRLYFIAGCFFLFALLIAGKLFYIQTVDGDAYKEMADNLAVKDFVIEPNRGSLYSDNGSLLATSVTRYDLAFDPTVSSSESFEAYVGDLSDSLAMLFGKSAVHYENKFRKARANKREYMEIAENLNYSTSLRLKQFPLFSLGQNRGGIILKQHTVREHPLGAIGERIVGHRRNGAKVGLEGAFNEYLQGKEGRRLMRKLGKKEWRPINDDNEIEPKDGYDVISTININIQDIAHHSLLKQLKAFNADHGSVVVMEVKSGEVKAMANLGKGKDGSYYERLNYAVGESHEPGSTFKLMTMVAALEDGIIDTNDIVDTKNGIHTFYKKFKVRDSNRRGYGKITASKAFEVSSNTGIVKLIDSFYRKNPDQFVDRLYNMGLNKKLELPIKGEGNPYIPHPNDKKKWSLISLPWMAYGYEVSLTPLQTLAFYNAIANDGEMVKPRLIKEIRELDKTIYKFDREIINPSICSEKTVRKVQQMLKNVVTKKHGTGYKLFSENFSMAGKTGTCQKNYNKAKDSLEYIATFAGYFPAENPKYSCIVVIHEPDKQKGYYGATVAGPVFKSIAQKIYSNSPVLDTVNNKFNLTDQDVEKDYQSFYTKAQKAYQVIPNVTGMSGMDAIALLENLGIEVEVRGNGNVKKQSLRAGEKIKSKTKIVLELS